MFRFLVGQEAEMGQKLGLRYHPKVCPINTYFLQIFSIPKVIQQSPQTGPPNGEKALKYRSFCKTFLAIL